MGELCSAHWNCVPHWSRSIAFQLVTVLTQWECWWWGGGGGLARLQGLLFLRCTFVGFRITVAWTLLGCPCSLVHFQQCLA